MRRILIVVDMQNDFINGALGSGEAVGIVDAVRARIEGFEGEVIFTRDTHKPDYLESQEGRRLPVEHCIEGSEGWQISSRLPLPEKARIFDKPAFGSVELAEALRAENQTSPIAEITLIGLCTDICVISNAMLLKAFLPETKIAVDAACCAGVTPDSHRLALEAMSGCQIDIMNF